MTDRPRDAQRQRVYDAHAVWKYKLGHQGIDLPTVADMQEYTDQLLAQKWIQKRFLPVSIKIKDGRSRSRGAASEYWDDMWELAMPKMSRYEAYLLHEISHVLETKDREDSRTHGAWHGWHFCKVMLDLVKHQMGQEAHDALEAEYRARKVNY